MGTRRFAVARGLGVIQWRLVTALGLVLFFPPDHVADARTTQEVFDAYADAVVRVQVLEAGSRAKAVVGSGFFVGGNGDIVTNYHVVSKLVLFPDRYRAECELRDGSRVAVSIVAIDVVHDVAVLRGEESGLRALTPAPAPVSQGTRLYALGHPHDLGLSIVEGTYNGLLEHSLRRKLHFTGSLNPGMSGGPTIDAAGRVVGVNVSTAGNQVSFLVPAQRVTRLLEEARRAPAGETPNFLEAVARQLLEHQDRYFAELLAQPMEKASFGPFQLPDKLAPFFRCWADTHRKPKTRYETLSHECSSEDYVYVSDGQQSGILQYRHHVITTDELNPFQFHSLYSAHFKTHYGIYGGDEEHVTRYSCRVDSVDAGNGVLRVAFCARAYRKLPGLYDVLLKAVVLGIPDAGAETAVAMSGVSFANATRLSRRILESISWNP